MSSRRPERLKSPARQRVKRRALAVGSVACGLATLAILTFPEPASHHVGRSATCERRIQPRLGGNVGEIKHYGFEYGAKLCAGQECAELVDMSGALEARALGEVRPGGDSVVQLRVMVERTSGEHLPKKESLATPMRVTVSPTGNVISVRYERRVDRPTARLLESIARELQVNTPECLEATAEWSAVENLVAANVMSHFKARGSEISWTRARVLLWRDGDALFPIRGRSSELTHSEHRVQLNTHGWVERLSGEDAYVVQQTSGGKMELRTKILVKDGRARVAAGPAPDPNQVVGFAKPNEHSEYADDERIAGHSLKTIVQELARLERVPDSKGPNENRLLVAAAALFRRDLSAAKAAAKLVLDGHEQRDFLIAALGEAGTAEAAQLLSELLRDARDDQVQLHLLGALGRTDMASPEVVEVMADYFDSPQLGGSARLMVGALAYQTRDTVPESSEAATRALVDDYNSAQNVLARADALRGLGNSGSSEGIVLAQKAAASPNATERAAAAQALRRVSSDAADRLLAKLMEDPTPLVRRSALDAALYRDPTELLVPAVQRLARLDSEASVRREAIRVLVRWKDEVPSARETLAWVSQNDSEQSLRDVAAEGLARFPT